MDELLSQPALSTPPGVTSHFPDTSNSRIIFYPIALFITLVPGVLFIIRIYTKLHIIGRLDITDITLSLAWPFFIALVALGWGIASNGGGAHQWNLRNDDLIHILYYCWLFAVLWGPCMFFLKATILLQYQRLFSPRRTLKPFMWWATNVIILANGIFYCLTMFTTAFACAPRAGAWNYLLPNAKCINFNLSTIITYTFNIVTDVIILVLPIETIWQLQISNRKRIGIIAMFAPGTLACVSSGMVIHYYLKAGESSDLSYYYRAVGCWGYAEISFGFIVSSAITLPKFFKAKHPLFTKYRSSVSRWFTSLGPRSSRSDEERATNMYPVSGNGSSEKRNKPRLLPEIQHIATITLSSKTDPTDRDMTHETINTVSEISHV